VDDRSVAEFEAFGVLLDQRNGFSQRPRQPVVSELDLVELLLRLMQGIVDDAGGRVRIKKAGVELKNCNQRREAELPGLEDRVQVPSVGPIGALRFVADEADDFALLVLHEIQVVEPPFSALEPGFEVLICRAHLPFYNDA
jgi:hypothetical protein